jgi:hypothetical protein
MRTDWKKSLCRVMRWKQDSTIDRVDGKAAIVVLREGASLRRNDFSADALGELLRSALACAVSGVDRYVHERIVKAIVKALSKRKLSGPQEELSIPAAAAIRASRAALRARRKGKAVRPANEIRKQIQELLHRRPYQNWRDIETGFQLIGIPGLGGRLQTAYHVAKLTPIRNQLNAIATRRNQVVHEGDLVRHRRGGKVRKQGITRKFVDDSIGFLETFVGHLESVF